jgi:peptidoglycan-associated lipoprotein
MFKKTQWYLAAAAASTLLFAACSSDETKTAPPEATPPPVTTSAAPTAPVPPPMAISAADLAAKKSVYFDLDKSDLKPESADTITLWAKYLAQSSASKVRIEGNCDERGSREYNVGLGERRANAVAQALEAQGVSPSQVSTVSYGKEKPVCSEHKEDCFAKNRRGDLVAQ